MTIEEITTRQEGQTFDCKSFSIDPKGLAVAMIAMANADGGEIAVGVSDHHREIEGVMSNEKHLNDLLRTPLDFCVPSVKASWELIDCINREGNADKVLVFHIQCSSTLHASTSDECYLRIGDRSRKLNFADRLSLLYAKGEQSFEDTPVFGAKLEDLNLNAVAEYISILGYGKSVPEFLSENNDFLRIDDNGRQSVSASAILLFGRNPQRFFPRARIRFIKYRGTEEKTGAQMNVVKDITYEGTILDQIRKMVELLELQIDELTYLGEDGRFVTKRQYPHFVLQELIVNAETHRDYSIKDTEIQVKMFDDKLVVESPGVLPGNVKPENIRHTHFSRNPHIAQFLKAYKFVKEFGEGVDRMSREMEQAQMLPPSYLQESFILRTTVKGTSSTEKGTSNEKKDLSSTKKDLSSGKKDLSNTKKDLSSGEKDLSRAEKDRILKLLRTMPEGYSDMSGLLVACGMKSVKKFRENYIDPAIKIGVIERLYPNSPTAPNQKYRMTSKGLVMLREQQ